MEENKKIEKCEFPGGVFVVSGKDEVQVEKSKPITKISVEPVLKEKKFHHRLDFQLRSHAF